MNNLLEVKMASLFKTWITTYRTPDGRKCKKGIPGSRAFRSRSKKWYGQFNDADGRIRRVPLCADKTAARQMLDGIVRQIERGEAGLINPLDEHRRKPLTDHLEQYRLHLEAKDNTDRHVRETIGQIKTLLDGCDLRYIADLDPEKISNYLKHRRKNRMSIERSNHYIRAIKAFTRWMEPRRVAQDPLRDLKTQDAARDRRLVRRSLAVEDFERLINATRESDAVLCGLTGVERAVLYLVAAYTGLRASELSSLTPGSFNFVEMSIKLSAGSSKNEKSAELPLHLEL